MVNDDDDCTMSASQVAEAYAATFFLRNSSEIKNVIDFTELDDLLWNMNRELKAKDAFCILEVHSKGTHMKGSEHSIPNEVQKV